MGVAWLPALNCGTAFQLVLGKLTLAMNRLNLAKDFFVWALSLEITEHCD